MKEYYVYGLIDPRTNTIFYIGKGKGKRVFHHLNEKNVFSNSEKHRIISEIQKEDFDYTHILICENISEDAALLLERILIYRIGREIFDEGILTNIVPGGKWNKEESIFLKKDDIPSIETINTQFPELIPVLEKYPHVANEFNGLGCAGNPEDEIIYVYDLIGNKVNEYDIDSFVRINGLVNSIDTINELKKTASPLFIYNQILSKYKLETKEDISKIPFQGFDSIDFQFVKRVNEAILTGNDTVVEGLYSNGNKHTELKLSNSSTDLTLIYYYPNENIKHITNHLEGRLNGKCRSWYPNGILMQEAEHQENKKISDYYYYPSGNMERSIIYNEDGTRTTKQWYDNGQLMRENNSNGVSYTYSETGVITCKSLNNGEPLQKGGFLMTWLYSQNGSLKKEIKRYYYDRLDTRGERGYEKTYYESGELKTEIDFTNGHDNEIVKSYKKNGEILIK